MQINIMAPINSLGYGTCGLNISLAFASLGHEPALWPIGPVEAPECHHDALRRMVYRTRSYDAFAPSLRIFHQFSLAEHVGKGKQTAYPIFELTRFKPNELHHLRSQDLLFVPSMWAADVLRDNGVQRVRVVPLAVSSIFEPVPVNQEGPTVFLNVGKWEVRKGHDRLVEAFCKAFSPQDNVRLVMNCFNPCFPTQEDVGRYNNRWVDFYKSSKMGDKIGIIPTRLPTQRDVAKLMAGADCGVFPSRAEGWNLEVGEMLAMGKEVIVTNYSAHTEFCDEENARIIEIDSLEDAYDGVWFDASSDEWQGRPGQWAKLGPAQVEQMVVHMRAVHNAKQQGLLKQNSSGIKTMEYFTWEQTARKLAGVLEDPIDV